MGRGSIAPMSELPSAEPNGINILALVEEGNQRFVFLYDDSAPTRKRILRVFEEYAADPELSFSSFDAAVLSERVEERRICRQHEVYTALRHPS